MRDKLKRDQRLLRKLGVASQKLVSMLTDASVGDRGVLRIKALVFGAIFTFLLTQKVFPPSCSSPQLIWNAGCFLGYQRIKKYSRWSPVPISRTN